MADYQLYQPPGQAQGPQPLPAPRPPRQEPQYGGISKCTQQYDLYEMIRHPHAAKNNRPPDSPSSSLKNESKQKRIEKDVERTFQRKQQSSSRSGITLLASLIKFLFLAFILPPYIILYRIPKFFIVTIIKIANAIDNFFTAIGRKIQDTIRRIKARIKGAFVGFWELIKATFKRKQNATQDDQPLSFLGFLAEGLVALYRVTIYPTISITKKGWRLSKRIARFLREAPMNLHNTIQDLHKRYLKIYNQILEKVKMRLLQAKEYLASKYFRPVSNWIDAKVEALTSFFRRLKESIKKAWASILYTCRHPILTYRKVKQMLKERAQKIYQSVQAKILARWNAICSIFQRLYAHVDNKLIQPYLQLRDRTIKKLRIFKEAVQNRFQRVQAVVRRLKAAIQTKIASIINPWLERPKRFFNKHSSLLQAHVSNFQNSLKTFYRAMLKKIAKRLEPITRFLKDLSAPFVWAGKELWNLVLHQAQPLIRFYKSCELATARLIYKLRRLVAWIHVLSRYGMDLVRGTAQELAGWL